MTTNNPTKPIVHIAKDEKFIDAAYDTYEKAFPGKNNFIILLKRGNSIRYLSKEKDYDFIDTDANYLSHIEQKIANARIIVFHSLNSYMVEIALAAKTKNLSLIWTVFGKEIYSNPHLFGKNLYGKKTYKRFVYSLKKSIKNTLRPYFYRVFKGQIDPNRRQINAFKIMDYIGIQYEEELNMIDNKVGLRKDVEQLKFTYYPLGLIINENQGRVTDNNILLGNSASYTNNHLETFDILKQMDLDTRQLIVPLSYGNKEYAHRIIKIGESTFGDSFSPLTNFLPLNEYQKILQNCGIVIMNHYRQQAVGNVLNSMYLGAKVYLSNKNTLYHYLKGLGCHVFCIEEELTSGNPYRFKLLNIEEIKKNREILKRELSLENIVKRLNNKIGHFVN